MYRTPRREALDNGPQYTHHLAYSSMGFGHDGLLHGSTDVRFNLLEAIVSSNFKALHYEGPVCNMHKDSGPGN
jgi:hypothetical protein